MDQGPEIKIERQRIEAEDGILSSSQVTMSTTAFYMVATMWGI